VYITLAYAWEWLDHGLIRWTTGEVVEGYSNFTELLWLTTAIALGADGGLAAKLFSLAGAFGLLGFASAILPDDRRGHLLVFALAAWSPLSYWSVLGLEGPIYALLLAAGWWMAIERATWAPGVALLAAAAMTRPEGLALFGAGLALGPLHRPDRRALGLAGAALAALAAFELWRWTHFGSLVSAPTLVKIGGVLGWKLGAGQAWRDLVVSAGVLGGAALLFRARRPLLALVPLALQIAVLVNADGDWMAQARLTFPGIAATALAWAGRSEVPTTALAPRAALAALAALVAGLFESRAPIDGAVRIRELTTLLDPITPLTVGFDTPVAEDVAWVVEHVPEGDTILATDIGLMGQIPGVRVRDEVGLVDRAFAEAVAGQGPWPLDDHGFFPAQAQFYRRVSWDGRPPGPPPGAERFVGSSDVRAGRMWSAWWRTHGEQPPDEVVTARWAELSRRYPTQPWLAWRYALSLADAGSVAHGANVLRAGHPLWSADPRAMHPELALSFVGGDTSFWFAGERGFALVGNGELTSRRLREGDALRLDADAPGEEGALARIRWIPDCGTDPVDVAVRGPAVYALDPPCDAAERIAVAFANDRAGPEGDRNLYAALVTGTGDPLPPPTPEGFERSAFTDGTVPLQRQGDRGFALYWSGELVSRPLSSAVTLLADADAPGEEGALASVAWDPPCGAPLEIRVTGPTELPLDPPACGAREWRLRVSFLNDASGPDGDRNLYVGLRRR
jgi:hypothetical protein